MAGKEAMFEQLGKLVGRKSYQRRELVWVWALSAVLGGLYFYVEFLAQG